MEYLKVANWDKWQTYRSDRGKPPWIKVHRELQQNWEWVDLPDHQRGQLVAIWLLASSRDGVIPASASKVKKLCNMSETPDLKALISLGFLEGDVTVTPDGSQGDATDKKEVKLSTEEETTLSGKPDYLAISKMILEYMNNELGSKFRCVDSNTSLITARLKEGYKDLDMMNVIDYKKQEWQNDPKMQKFLRPKTLFNATNFNQYFGQLGIKSEADRKYDEWLDDGNVIEGDFNRGK